MQFSHYCYEFLDLFFLNVRISTFVNRDSSPLRKIPGPTLAALTSLYIKYFTITAQKSRKVHELHKKYGPVVRISPIAVSVSDLSDAKQIFSISQPSKKTLWYMRFNSGGEPGIFNMSDIAKHRACRRILAYGFSQTNLDIMEPIIRPKVTTAVAKMRRDLVERKLVTDVFKWWMFMATDVITTLCFEESFHMLEKEEMNEHMQDLSNIGIVGTIYSEIPLPGKFLDTLAMVLPKSKLKGILTFPRGQIEHGKKALALSAKRTIYTSDKTTRPTLLSKLFDTDPKKGDKLSMRLVQFEASNMLGAVTDTTALTLVCLLVLNLCHSRIRPN
ncbi:hypothetical protein RUND412_004856, partial [Rhizina undulata]